ncbi:MAG: SMP-30/gluconolactonase/LRE family protein [Thermoanaerobaculia bacterium]
MQRGRKLLLHPGVRRMRGLLGVALLAFGCSGREEDPAPGAPRSEGAAEVTVAFRLPDPEVLPEGIARDPRDGWFYLSDLRRRQVLRRTADGAWEVFVQASPEGSADGLLGTAGLAIDVDRDLLWVASARADATLGPPSPEQRSGVWAFRLRDGSVAHRLLVPPDGPHLINDLTVLPDGRVFATDTAADSVWEARVEQGRSEGDRLEGDRLELFAASRAIASPNGLAASPDGSSLYVAHRKGIARLPLDGSAGEQLGEALRGVDGLELLDGALLAVQNGSGVERIVLVQLPFHEAEDAPRALVEGPPALEVPTTCTVDPDVGAWCIASSHLTRPVADLPRLEPSAVLHLPAALLTPAR